MKNFDIIRRKQKLRVALLNGIIRKAFLDRPDLSRYDLNNFIGQGYEDAAFEANPACCAECQAHDGEIYDINELLELDNPLYRITHPNCNCKFIPYGQSAFQVEETEETQEEPVTEGI